MNDDFWVQFLNAFMYIAWHQHNIQGVIKLDRKHIMIGNFYHIYNLIQAIKKVCGPKKAIVKKDVKSKVAAKK